MSKSNNKIVYFLGAGFSYGAGIPTQYNMLSEILNLDSALMAELFTDWERIESSKKKIREFIDNIFTSNNDANIEDLFTIIDRCIAGKEHIHNFSWQDLYLIRNNLINLIIFFLNSKLSTIPEGCVKNYRKFVRYLLQERINTQQKNANITVITSNWDTLLEKMISWKQRTQDSSSYICNPPIK